MPLMPFQLFPPLEGFPVKVMLSRLSEGSADSLRSQPSPDSGARQPFLPLHFCLAPRKTQNGMSDHC